MQKCKNCRYWSEMLAQALDGGPVEAICLNALSPHSGQYTAGIQSCGYWLEATHGAIDDPRHGGTAYLR